MPGTGSGASSASCAGKLDRVADAGQAAAHQRDVGASAYRDADVRGRQGGCIISAVATTLYAA